MKDPRKVFQGISILLFAVTLCLSLLNIYLLANQPCTAKMYCRNMAHDDCVSNCGGTRSCKSYTIQENYCSNPLECYSHWLIQCLDPWEYYYYNCWEYERTCKNS
jgi:hypothetical protein